MNLEWVKLTAPDLVKQIQAAEDEIRSWPRPFWAKWMLDKAIQEEDADWLILTADERSKS